MKEKFNKFLEQSVTVFFHIFTFGKYRKLDKVKTEYEKILDDVSAYVGNLNDMPLAMYYYDKLNNMIQYEGFSSYNQMIEMYKNRIDFLEKNFPDVPIIKTRLRERVIDDIIE